MDIKAIIKTCRNCGNDIKEKNFFPFCSKRCQQTDLGNWASGKYAVPSDEDEISIEDLKEEI